MSSRGLFKTPKEAIKIIDCSAIDKISLIIEENGISLEEKARKIKNELVTATLDKDSLYLIDGIEEFIIENKYDDAAKLSNDIWLKYRRGGIGGSDASALLGVSKWNTGLSLYYDKLGKRPSEVIDRGKQYIFDFGHAMEEFVAKHYEKVFFDEYKESVEFAFSLQYGEKLEITNARVFRDTYMYKHPEHPCMRADLDFCIEFTFSDGKKTVGVFECKTTSPFHIKDEWEVSAPAYYICQTRHYMAVKDFPFTIIACAADNNVNNYFSHVIFRNKKIEREMIKKEEVFWEHVQTQNPPFNENEDNSKILFEKVKEIETPKPKKNNSPIIKNRIKDYEKLGDEIASKNSEVKSLEKQRRLICSNILTEMMKADTNDIVSNNKEASYRLSIKDKISNSTDWQKFLNLLIKAHPELKEEVKEIKQRCTRTKVTPDLAIDKKHGRAIS